MKLPQWLNYQPTESLKTNVQKEYVQYLNMMGGTAQELA